jgi:hypothetical protein
MNYQANVLATFCFDSFHTHTHTHTHTERRVCVYMGELISKNLRLYFEAILFHLFSFEVKCIFSFSKVVIAHSGFFFYIKPKMPLHCSCLIILYLNMNLLKL